MNPVEVHFNFNVNYLSSAAGAVVARAERRKRGGYTSVRVSRRLPDVMDKTTDKAAKAKERSKAEKGLLPGTPSSLGWFTGLVFPDSGATLLQFPRSAIPLGTMVGYQDSRGIILAAPPHLQHTHTRAPSRTRHHAN